MSKPYLLTSVYLNEFVAPAAAPVPPPTTVVWERPLKDVSLTAGVYDSTPTTGCRLHGAGTITGDLGVFHVSGYLTTTGVGGGGATWDEFFPPMAAIPTFHGTFMAIANPGAALLPADISVGLDGTLTLGGGTSLAAGDYLVNFTIACRLA